MDIFGGDFGWVDTIAQENPRAVLVEYQLGFQLDPHETEDMSKAAVLLLWNMLQVMGS